MSQTRDATEFVVVDSAEGAATALAAIRDSAIVGIDTEFVGESSYEPELCLLQVATSDAIWLVDPLAGIDLSEIWQALTDPDREIVAFAARQELLFGLRFAGRLPGRLFDPQIAAGLLGFGYPLSHTNLVQKVINVRVQGGEAYSDWRKRPLSKRQSEYAADDVRQLLTIRRALIEQATGLGRLDWLSSESQAFADRVKEAESEERWWRTSGGSGLNRRALARLRELWRWRDDTARAANRPPKRVLGDDLLVAIAKRGPRDLEGLLALRGLDRPQLRKVGGEILTASLAGNEVPEDELPQLRRRDDPAQVAILGQLAAILVNSLAVENEVDAALLATTADLQEFIRGQLGLSDGKASPLLEGWRGEVFGLALVELLQGKRFIRVGDMNSASPLRIEALES